MIARFGPFTLDGAARQLSRDGRLLHLSPKAFDLLRLIVERAPAAVSKADALQHLWPDTYVVEANVANLMAEIRQTLEDDPKEPRVIRTVARFGYALVGERTIGEDARSPFTLLAGRRAHRLPMGETVIGRDSLPEIFDSPGVSRRHARITVVGTTAVIEDLQSKNGTYVGEWRIAGAVPLRDGDRIRIGDVVVTFSARDDQSTRTIEG